MSAEQRVGMPTTRSRVEQCFKLSRGWWSIRDVMGSAHTSYTLTRLALNAMHSEGLLEERPRSGNNTKPEREWRVIAGWFCPSCDAGLPTACTCPKEAS